MPYTLKLRNMHIPFAQHPGVLSFHVRHRDAYALNTRFSIPSLFTSINRTRRGLDMNMLERFPATAMDNGYILSLHNEVYRCPNAVTGAVLNATTGRVRITCVAHGLLTGEVVTIRQVQGATEANITSEIVRIGVDDFDLVDLTTAVTAFSSSANSIVECSRPLPTLTITGLTTAGVITTAAHGLSVGDEVWITTVSGLTGPSIADYVLRKHIVSSVPSSTTFKLEGLTWSGGAFSGSAFVMPLRSPRLFGCLRLRTPRTLGLTNISNAASAVFTTESNHGLRVGDLIDISKVLDSTLGGVVNGRRRVRTVPSATTFTVETEAGALVSGASGTYTANSGQISGLLEPVASETPYCEGVVEMNLYKTQDRGPFSGPLNL